MECIDLSRIQMQYDRNWTAQLTIHIAHILTYVHRVRRRTEVHRNRSVNRLPQLLVPNDVVLRDRALKNGDILPARALLQLLDHRHSTGEVLPRGIRVQVELERRRDNLRDRRHLLHDVIPRPWFQLHRGVAVLHRRGRLRGPVFGGRVDGPPGDGDPVADSLAQ